MATDRFDNNLPLESVLSRKTREGVNGETRESSVTGESAAAFFPAAGTGVHAGGLTRAAGEEGATAGTADGLNGHPDARQGKAAASVPDEVPGSNDDGDANDDGTPDA